MKTKLNGPQIATLILMLIMLMLIMLLPILFAPVMREPTGTMSATEYWDNGVAMDAEDRAYMGGDGWED